MWGNQKGSIKDLLDEYFDNKIRANFLKPKLIDNGVELLKELCQ